MSARIQIMCLWSVLSLFQVIPSSLYAQSASVTIKFPDPCFLPFDQMMRVKMQIDQIKTQQTKIRHEISGIKSLIELERKGLITRTVSFQQEQAILIKINSLKYRLIAKIKSAIDLALVLAELQKIYRNMQVEAMAQQFGAKQAACLL